MNCDEHYIKEKQEMVLRLKKIFSPIKFKKFLKYRFYEIYHLDDQRQILEPLGIPVEKYCCKDCKLKDLLNNL